MAKRPRQLTLRFSDLANARLTEIWRWNADKYGDAHATEYIEFLKSKTLALRSQYSLGRQVPGRPAYRYMIFKKRPRGHGYVIVYEVLKTEIFVFYYFHTAQDWLTQLEEVLPKT
jgi:plasmid stabilization system protein ParE